MMEFMETYTLAMYSSLSKAELAELHMDLMGNISVVTTMLITLLFGFLTAVYLVAHKLTRSQVFVFTGMYSAFSLLLQMQGFMMGLWSGYIVSMLSGLAPVYGFVIAGSALGVIMWIASLIYVYQRRKQSIE